MSILKQIKWKDQNGTETLMDIGADAVNVVTDSTHRFASDAEKSKWNAKMETTSDAADNTVSFTPAGTRSNISSGEKLSNIFGKIAKYFTDLKAVAFSGNYNDLTNKPAALKNPNALKANGKTYDGSAAVDVGTVGIAYGGTGATTAAAARINLGLGTAATQGVANNCTTTAAGYALDARQGKVLKEEVNELNGSLQAVNNKINNNIYAIKQNLPGATLQPYKSYSTVATVQDINGYTPIFAIPANSGNADLAWTRCEITSGYSLNIGLFNVHENAQTTSRITVIVVYKING